MGHWTFLLITDLHYQLPEANYLDDPKEIKEIYNRPLRDRVFKQLEKILQSDYFTDIGLSFIAIGGDITTHGKLEGFTEFQEKIFPKLQNMVPSSAICIVPGNHDVVWEVDPLAEGYFEKKFKAFRQMVQSRKMTTCLFPRGELSLSDEPRARELEFKIPDRGPFFVDDRKRVLVLNVNSAIRCGELNRQMLVDIREHVAKSSKTPASPADPPLEIDKVQEELLKKYLVRDISHVTQAQVTELQDFVEDEKKRIERIGHDWQSYLKVALMHHHVVHYASQQTEHKGYEFMVDSPSLLQFLESFDFDIVLTGHKHQAYEKVERFDKKEMFIIGGPTIGGYTSEDRGFRLVDFESNQSFRKVEIRDIKMDFASGDIAQQIQKCVRHPLQSVTPTKTVVDRAAEKVGYRYREVASMTVISPDGDAHRIVECEDLVVTKQSCKRAAQHPLNLPPTSGYLTELRSKGSGFKVSPDKQLPRDHSAQRADNISLKFDPPIELGKPFSYRYEWLAVNSFALDKLQFDRMYGDQEELKYTEYTHFIAEDPIEDLTVVVQFPRDFKLEAAPRLRVAKIDPKQEDSRQWVVDHEMVNLLKHNHALRFYESLNAAAVRVKAPSSDLAYGIQWDLPKAAVRPGADQLDRILQHFSDRDHCLKSVRDALKAARRVLVPGWKGELDGSLMTFAMVKKDGKPRTGQLRNVAALRSMTTANGKKDWETLAVKTTLPYGRGIAGRAFKANRIRVHVAPKQESDLAIRHTDDDEKIAPDFYEQTEGSEYERVLVSFPLHVPVDDQAFQKKSDVYEGREPYAVMNIGSRSEECPISALLEEENRAQLLLFQHLVNKRLYDQAFPSIAPSKSVVSKLRT